MLDRVSLLFTGYSAVTQLVFVAASLAVDASSADAVATAFGAVTLAKTLAGLSMTALALAPPLVRFVLRRERKTARSGGDDRRSDRRWDIPMTEGAVRATRPLAEAISTAGGVSFRSLDHNLMLTTLSGVFVAGEMIDWEAPTGGYLLNACFATGLSAGLGMRDWLAAVSTQD
jgi:predicted flavoprotein YhiN